MFFQNKFTERAANVLTISQKTACRLGHSYIGTEHILYGIIKDGGGIAFRVLNAFAVTESKVLAQMDMTIGRGTPIAKSPQGMTDNAKRVIELSISAMHTTKYHHVETEHILMAILREGKCGASLLLKSLNIDLKTLGRSLIESTNIGVTTMSQDMQTMKKNTSTKNLDQHSFDLTEQAKLGKLDPVLGREHEISRMIEIISRRTKNNPVLIGEAGVGKTALAEGLAIRINNGDVPKTLRSKRLLSLDLSSIISGTKYRGEFEERMKNILNELVNSDDIIVFIDEIHMLIGAGAADGAIDASNILKPVLARGKIQLIGATTLDEYTKHIEKDLALERRFQKIQVDPPTSEQAIAILHGLRDKYEIYHNVNITDEAINCAVNWSMRYITDRQLPDKAIDLIDEASARVRLRPEFEKSKQKVVTSIDIGQIISSWTGINISKLTQTENQKLLQLEPKLNECVLGQQAAASAISKAIRRSRVGMRDPSRPIGSFIFLGTTGVGKTELSKALAKLIFGYESSLIRLDMSEYMEAHTVSRLIGAPAGYIGHESGGQLTEKVKRKPYSVVLFDEIEKAHPDISHVLLQILDDGKLTDATGREIDFKNTIIIMTSNIGAKKLSQSSQNKLGFCELISSEQTNRDMQKIAKQELKKFFSPEFLNRLDDIIVFNNLTHSDMTKIACKMLKDVQNRMIELNFKLEWSDMVCDHLACENCENDYSARHLRRKIQTHIEDPIVEKILHDDINYGQTIYLDIENNSIKIQLNKELVNL